jgi:predicted O-methyltransferase YrrM
MHYARISFCFLDTEKELYRSCYDALIPRMVRGGLLVADNAISHGEVLLPFIEAALQDPRVDAMVVPVGSGELVCRKA